VIQILALREFFSKKQNRKIKSEVWFDRGIRAESVEDIFAKGGAHFLAGKVDISERFNLYYTVADCLEEPGRKLKVQHHIPFDVDKIDIDEDNGEVNYDPLRALAHIVCDAIGVPYKDCNVLFSGGGIQILVGIETPIESVEYFDAHRRQYKAICDKINLRLMQAGMKGEADPSVWSPARLMRLPGTLNIKPGRPERKAHILNSTTKRNKYDIKIASGLPDIQVTEQISETILKAFPTPDVKAIMSECQFLAFAQIHPEKLSEPEWYSALSVTARFPEGRKFSHKLSEGHPAYSFNETEQKIEQSIQSSGPRTCANINAISGGKCAGCKHLNSGLKSPILIEGPDHVKTSKSGFHNVYVTKEGTVKIGKPDYNGLTRWFNREHRYVSIDTAKTIWTWNGKHFEEYSRDRVFRYAHEHFEPASSTTMRNEFFETMRLFNMQSVDWFTQSIEGKMNFQNGVLDVKSGVLTDHSTDIGFRSVLPCAFDSTAKAPRFLQFMDEVTMGRPSLQKIIQEYLGYIFANGDCKHQKILVLLGTGENGKSKLIDLIRALAGDQGFSSLSVKSMYSDQNRALMEGKLVNIAEENSRDSFRDTEFIKNMASGGFISVKRLYAQPYEYQNKTKLVMLCNEAPYTADLTHGFYRRLLMVPFDQIFSDEKGNKDPDILEKLLTELPGIFNWIMEGYRRLEKQNKFTDSKESNALLHKYKIDTDSILAWATDNLEFDEDGTRFVNRQELYNDYVQYCEQNGLKPYSSIRLNEYIRNMVIKKGKIPKEEKKRKDDVRFYAINHIKHLTLPQF
jgi:P4 family phage/plasmid primase-like protien